MLSLFLLRRVMKKHNNIRRLFYAEWSFRITPYAIHPNQKGKVMDCPTCSLPNGFPGIVIKFVDGVQAVSVEIAHLNFLSFKKEKMCTKIFRTQQNRVFQKV